MLYPSMSTSHVSFPCPAHVPTVLMSTSYVQSCTHSTRTRAAAEVRKQQTMMQSRQAKSLLWGVCNS